jgi:hypothetical protein
LTFAYLSIHPQGMLERLERRKEKPVTLEEAEAKVQELGCEMYCEVSALSQKGLHAMVRF